MGPVMIKLRRRPLCHSSTYLILRTKPHLVGPLPETGNDLRWKGHSGEASAGGSLRLLAFRKGLLGDVGQSGQHARSSKQWTTTYA
jgi:hypothetical protein